MTEHFHFLVWIDHQIAKIINFNRRSPTSASCEAPGELNICAIRRTRATAAMSASTLTF